MKRIIILLLLLVPLGLRAQKIQHVDFKVGPNGVGTPQVYSSTQSNVDSVWTVLVSAGTISGVRVYSAQKYNSAGSIVGSPYGPLGLTSQWPYKIAGGFAGATATTSGAVLNASSIASGAIVRFEAKSIPKDTGTTLVGTPTGDFVVTGIIVEGNNDTTGYTSNITVKIGTNASTYDNQCASASPSLGAAGVAAATLVSPRKTIPSGTPIYAHVTTAGVATTETFNVTVTGYYK